MPTIPFSYECSKDAGFVMDPNEAKRVGYIIELEGFQIAKMNQDLHVCVPYNHEGTLGYTEFKPEADPGGGPLKIVKVVGVIEKFEWNGGVGDPLKFEFYVSQTNAHNIKAAQQTTLKTTTVKTLKFWICDFDQETKRWFEQAYPKSKPALNGLITGKENPELDVDLNPVAAKDGIDVNVYKVTMGVVPAANEAFALHFANSSEKPVAKSWGLKVGDLAKVY
jgi:hypothetical protein